MADDTALSKRTLAVQAAVTVFRSHGFSGASISMLVEATGQSRSTLYAEFGDKGGLFTAALGHYCENIDALVSRRKKTSTAEELLRRSVRRLAKTEEGLPCLLTRSCLELADLPAGAKIIVAEALEAQWNGLIDAETANGEPTDSEINSATRDLAMRHGLAALAAAGVPTSELLASTKAS